jgi:sulfur carrier protein
VVKVNGQVTELPEGCTVAALVARLEQRGRVAVERNRDIVPRASWPTAQLSDGDQVEIVTFVGGG